jgi:very-short-patch-repair endonuclease
MRLDPTSSEARLWKLLRALNREGANFRRQAAVDNFVYDFADYSARVLIEQDGGVHAFPEAIMRDMKKTLHAKQNGFDLLRVTNDDVWKRPDWVFGQVRAFRAAPRPLPPPRKGEGES